MNIDSAWPLLTDASKDKISSFVDNAPLSVFLEAANPLSKIDSLEENVRRRIDVMDEKDLEKGINEYNFRGLAKDRALDFLEKSGTWEAVNSRMQKLVFPIFEFLESGDVERIIKMPSECNTDLPGAYEYGRFVEMVKGSNIFCDDGLRDLLEENKAGYLLKGEVNGE